MHAFLIACALSLTQSAKPSAPNKIYAEKKAVPARTDELIDLNTASKATLMTLPGIRDAHADKVVAKQEDDRAKRECSDSPQDRLI